MRKLKLLSLSVIAVFCIAVVSCIETEVTRPEARLEINDEIKSQFYELGFDASDMRVGTYKNLITGKSEEVYVLEGDIMINKDQMEEMQRGQKKSGPTTEQYRTTNLVAAPRTISVLGFTGTSANALDATMRTALQMAVENYNEINLGLTFTLAFGTNTAGFNIVVQRVDGPGGGQAGFPSGGNPFSSVIIQAGTSNYGIDVTEHVMTHEIGHCVGLRHTDYFNRAISCGSGGNEGDAGVGAIHIPGTPAMTNIDMNSVMLACFNAFKTGEFSGFDVTSLRTLYPGTPPGGGGTYLTVSPTFVGFGSSSGSRTISVSSDGPWSVSDNAGWITVSPTSGINNGSFVISVSTNNMLCEPRDGVVTINGGSAGIKTVFVSQAGRTPRPGEHCP